MVCENVASFSLRPVGEILALSCRVSLWCASRLLQCIWQHNKSPKPTPGSAVALRGSSRGGAACLNRSASKRGRK